MSTQPNGSALPPDDPTRVSTVVDPDDPGLTHLAVVGDTYTFLINGEDTGGRYALIDMLIPAGGGPPPHRHNFEERFHVLEGTVEVTVRGETSMAGTGTTVNIPSNAPHSFTNPTDASIRLLCMVSPSGLEEFFEQFGDEVDSRTTSAPELSEAEQKERVEKSEAVAARYGIENL